MRKEVQPIKGFKAKMADAQLGNDQIVYMKLAKDITDIEAAKEFLELFKTHFYEGEPIKLVVDARQHKKSTKACRDYYGRPEIANYFKHAAFLVKPGLSKVAINLFFKFSKPAFPSKAFANEEKAMEWLLSQ